MSHQITSNSLTPLTTVDSADAKVVCSWATGAAAAVEFLLFAKHFMTKKNPHRSGGSYIFFNHLASVLNRIGIEIVFFLI
jgi:hypothetical protein